MNAPVNLPEDGAVTELAVIPSETALAVLTDAERFDEFYAKVKSEVDAHVPDLKSAKGREAIKSLAFKVTKTKTAIDAAGKVLTEEWRSQTQKVDAARKAIRDKLDALRDEVRKPLTDWEAAEEQRIADCQAALDGFKACAVVRMGETAAEVSGRLADLQATTLSPKLFGDLINVAEAALEHAKMILEAAVNRLAKEEADRAELEALRAAAAEREEAERVAREAQARAEAAAVAARIEREAEERRAADAAAAAEERERQHQAAVDRAAAEAAASARAEAEAEAKAEREGQERAAQAGLEAERAARAAAEGEAQRLAAEKAAAERLAREEAEAAAKREADVKHRGGIMAAAKAALMATGGIGEDAAKRIVLAIKANEIPNVSIRF